MAAYGSFHAIFENPRQDKTPKSFLETLSSSSHWNPTKGIPHVTDHHETPLFTEIFGELHFREPVHSSYEKTSTENNSLQLCTEGLGAESYYDLEDEKVNANLKGYKGEEEDEIDVKGTKDNGVRSNEEEECGVGKKERIREYPPAMTRMSFKTYREEGRLVLEEVRIPRREFLRASREDGRLRLKLVQPEDEEDDEEEEEEEEEKDKPN